MAKRSKDPFQRYLDAVDKSTKAQLEEGRIRDELRAHLDASVTGALEEAGKSDASPYRFGRYGLTLFAQHKTVQLTLDGLFDKKKGEAEKFFCFGCGYAGLTWLPGVKSLIVSRVLVPEGWKISVMIRAEYFLD